MNCFAAAVLNGSRVADSSVVDGDKPVSRDVFAIWRGMQDWIVETGLLSPLDLI